MHFRLHRLWCVVVLGAATACGGESVALGDDEKDDLKVKGTRLAYFAGSFASGLDDNPTLADLFALGDDAIAKAPDPTALLTTMNAVDDDRTHLSSVPLSVLDYNVALLDAPIFGVIPYARTPHLDERRTQMPGLVFASGADVITLQEVWRDEDVERFVSTGRALGYVVLPSPRTTHTDGLIVCIKEAIVEGGTTPDIVESYAYAAQDGKEYFPGPQMKRGFLHVRFVHDQAGEVHVFDTHTQAFPEHWRERMRQVRELGIAAREVDDNALVVVAGDLNSGPYYVKDEWKVKDAATQTTWFENAIAYPLLLEYGNLVDAAIMGRPAADAAADVVVGKTVKNDADKAVKTPGVSASWCDDTAPITLTATDCNQLYFEQYAGTEYPARLDHIHVRERNDIVVANSNLLYVDKYDFGDVTIEPSDHYAVHVQLLVAPAR